MICPCCRQSEAEPGRYRCTECIAQGCDDEYCRRCFRKLPFTVQIMPSTERSQAVNAFRFFGHAFTTGAMATHFFVGEEQLCILADEGLVDRIERDGEVVWRSTEKLRKLGGKAIEGRIAERRP